MRILTLLLLSGLCAHGQTIFGTGGSSPGGGTDDDQNDSGRPPGILSPISQEVGGRIFTSEFGTRVYAYREVHPSVRRGEPVGFLSSYSWKANIVTTLFWIGEAATSANPVDNYRSAWDHQWMSDFGGYDDPDRGHRSDWRPKGFTPRMNPFYIALPYNDRVQGGVRSEAPQVVPWWDPQVASQGKSNLRGRWLAIRKGDRVCYAQWEDVGPFQVDHWQYVFGNERPRPNHNHGAGLDVSPAVRDFLGLAGIDMTDWRFVEASEVPPGPWKQYPDEQAPGILPHVPESAAADDNARVQTAFFANQSDGEAPTASDLLIETWTSEHSLRPASH